MNQNTHSHTRKRNRLSKGRWWSFWISLFRYTTKMWSCITCITVINWKFPFEKKSKCNRLTNSKMVRKGLIYYYNNLKYHKWNYFHTLKINLLKTVSETPFVSLRKMTLSLGGLPIVSYDTWNNLCFIGESQILVCSYCARTFAAKCADQNGL